MSNLNVRLDLRRFHVVLIFAALLIQDVNRSGDDHLADRAIYLSELLDRKLLDRYR